MSQRRIIQGLLVAAFALAVPASASANFSVTDAKPEKLLVSGDDGVNKITVYFGTETGNPTFQISVDPPETITESSTHCAPHPMFPTAIVYCDYGMDRFVTKLGGGKDSTFILRDSSDQAWPDPVALSLVGGEGDDALRSADGDDTLKGGSGLDRLLGNAGKDKLLAKDGETDRQINCGPGNDPAAKRDNIDPKPKSC